MRQLLVFGSAFGAGMINSVAGGGTLLSFPTLISIQRKFRTTVRRIVVGIGIGMALALLVKAP